MKTVKLIIIFLLCAVYTVNAQKATELTYEAYLSGSLIVWEKAVNDAASLVSQEDSNENKFQLANSMLGLLGATMATKDENRFDKYAEEAESILKELSESGFRKEECNAMLASILGYHIAYSPWKGMYLGPKNTALIDDALEGKPDSPIVQKMYAQHQYFTPEMWGGNVNNAIKAFEYSNKLFEESGVKNNWMYLDNMAWLGMAHKKVGNNDLAKQVWKKALVIEPDFKWVEKALLPSLSK